MGLTPHSLLLSFFFPPNATAIAFPWDKQALLINFQSINFPGDGRVRIIPSARGLHLFRYVFFFNVPFRKNKKIPN